MSAVISISTRRRYGVARVCRVWAFRVQASTAAAVGLTHRPLFGAGRGRMGR